MTEKPKSGKGDPQITFVIGHRGTDRAPLLLRTIESIAGQTGCVVACLVVEQDTYPKIRDQLPSWVDYLFIPIESNTTPYSRSMAFNKGATAIKTDYFVVHDNDILVPETYAFELLERFNQGDDFVDLKRFIFYLTEESTALNLSTRTHLEHIELESIMQNSPGGGSTGVRRKAFFDIGGFDERFIGWGGEDNEFWERAKTRKAWAYASLPLVHLWHPSQPEKAAVQNRSDDGLYEKLNRQPAEERIKRLIQLNRTPSRTQ